MASVSQIRAQVAGREFNIIHSQQEFGDVLALCLKSHVKAKRLVRTVHNTVEWRYRPLRRALLTNLLIPLSFDLGCAINDPISSLLSSRPLSRSFLKLP